MGTAKRERQKQGRYERLEAARAAEQRSRRLRTVRNFGIAAVAIVAAVFLLSRQFGDDDKTPTTTQSDTSTTSSTVAPPAFAYGTGPCPAADGSAARTIDFTAAPMLCLDPAKSYTAVFDTTAGTVKVKLDSTTTPGTTNNFVVLARYHYYDGTTLFRTNTGIGIIQGGSPHDNTSGDKGPGYDLPDEGFDFTAIGGQGGPYKYVAGDLVMARASKPNGAGAQFFFGATDAVSGLDSQGIYVKFGSATEGVDVLQKILSSAPEGEGAPNPPVTVNTVTITES